ncbi:hypothetical protein ACLB2K_020384 [Fragaria x ananassa]
MQREDGKFLLKYQTAAIFRCIPLKLRNRSITNLPSLLSLGSSLAAIHPYLQAAETSPVILFFTISLIALSWSFLLILNRFVLRLDESSIRLTPAARRVSKEIQNPRLGGFTGIICVDGLGGLSTVLVVPEISELTEDAVARSNHISHDGGRLKSISSLSKRDMGQKLSEVNDLYLVEVGTYCSFNQLLECGFYHADPHPGNLLRTYDGKLAYLDFGMMGEFKEELRNGFIEASLHLVNRDFGALAKDFVTLGLIPPTADKEAVTKALTGVFQNAVAKGVSNISFGDLLGDLGTTMYKFKLRIPSYFSLVIRSLAVLEGVAIGFNPDYKVLGSTYPWIARKILTDNSPQLKASLQALLYEEGVFRIDRLESLLAEVKS